MSRLNPCENTRVGASSGPTTFTARAVPSKDVTLTSRPGRSARGSSRSGSGRFRARWISHRETAAPAATARTPVAAATAAAFPPPWRVGRCSALGTAGSLINVLPRNPVTDAAHHLVVDRAHPAGHLVRGDPSVPLRADQDHLVARFHRIVSAVQHDLVHA